MVRPIIPFWVPHALPSKIAQLSRFSTSSASLKSAGPEEEGRHKTEEELN
jgi:hypothetical protein